MNTLYLITGPAGVGKTTVSEILANSLTKSALVEGDTLYHMVKGGYVSAWKPGNHKNMLWMNTINVVNNFLQEGYDVVYNYILTKEDVEFFRKSFKKYNIKFAVLMTNGNVLIDRDLQRPEDCQMGERCKILLEEFVKQNFDSKYIINTTNKSPYDIAKKIANPLTYNIV